MSSLSEKQKSRFCLLLLAVFLLSLIPLYALGFKAHPSVDDYYYGAETARVWNESGDFGAAVSLSWDLMKESYRTWQGNFAAIFLMRLQPGIFGEQAYAAAPIILITSFAAAMLCFFCAAFRKLLKASLKLSFAAALVLTGCAMQFTYRPVDSFYWFNGGIYYTFFFSLSLFAGTLLILAGTAASSARRLAAAAGAVLLAFLVGGGNYSTALFSAVLLASLAVFLFVKKDLRAALPVSAALLALLVSLFISIAAPGNAVRQAVTGESSGVLKALLYSFAYGGYSLAEGLNFPVAVVWMGLLPVLYRLSGRVKGRFPLPLLVLLFTFGIYSSQGTALFYAQGLRMPPRMSNIIYFNAYLFISFNLVYFCGWLKRRFPGNPLERAAEALFASDKRFSRFTLCLCLLFALGCIGLCRVSEGENGGAVFEPQPLSVSAAYSLLSGEAARYDEELSARAAFLSAQLEGAAVTVKPLSAYPPALSHSEITADPADFKNDHLARYYHLGSVTLGDRE